MAEYVESNAPEVAARLAKLAERAAMPAPAFTVVMEEMEHHEESVFAAYGGKYVRTGDLEASLTSASATGAIRRMGPHGLEFGSSIWYGRFQGTEGPGDHRGPSAVLTVTPSQRIAFAAEVGRYIAHGERL